MFLGCIAIVGLMYSGCRTLNDAPFGSEVVHNELLTYDLSFDKTYMLVIEAINETPGWTLASTDKGAGKIYAMTNSFNYDETACLLVKRIDRKKTSVELAPEAQVKKGVEELLKRIDLKLSKSD
jgi:hypothetical protein